LFVLEYRNETARQQLDATQRRADALKGWRTVAAAYTSICLVQQACTRKPLEKSASANTRFQLLGSVKFSSQQTATFEAIPNKKAQHQHRPGIGP